VRYRRLVRASGSMVRCMPVVRLFTDIWFPTPLARALRAILDKKSHRGLVAGADGAHLLASGHRRIDAALLCAALPSGRPAVRGRLAVVLQQFIDSVDRRVIESYEDERTFARLLHRPQVRRALRWACWAAAALLVLAAVDTAVFQTSPDSKPGSGTAGSGGPDAKSSRQQRVQQALSQTEAPRQPPVPGSTMALPEPAPPAAGAVPCRPYLMPEPDYVQVYRIHDMGEGCGIGDCIFTDEKGLATTIRSVATVNTRYFIMRRTAAGWSRIITVRMCTRGRAGFVAGEFYEAAGYTGLGGRVTAATGDMLGFNWFGLNRYKNEHQ